MDKRIGQVVLECILDLGITVVYATLAGLVIVAVVASDDGPISLWTAALYASLLPGAVVTLIGCDLVLRVFAQRRADRRLRGVSASTWFGRKPCVSDG